MASAPFSPSKTHRASYPSPFSAEIKKMREDEGKSERSHSQMMWVGKITHTTVYSIRQSIISRISHPQLKAAVEPAAKRLEFHS